MNNNTGTAMDTRVKNFSYWWRKNKNNNKAFLWLTSHAKRIAFSYNLPPYTWDEICTINKRHLHSEHKRMSRGDAWKLWKFVHPLATNRIDRITASGEFLMEQKLNKSTLKPKKEVTVVYKNRIT